MKNHVKSTSKHYSKHQIVWFPSFSIEKKTYILDQWIYILSIYVFIVELTHLYSTAHKLYKVDISFLSPAFRHSIFPFYYQYITYFKSWCVYCFFLVKRGSIFPFFYRSFACSGRDFVHGNIENVNASLQIACSVSEFFGSRSLWKRIFQYIYFLIWFPWTQSSLLFEASLSSKKYIHFFSLSPFSFSTQSPLCFLASPSSKKYIQIDKKYKDLSSLHSLL